MSREGSIAELGAYGGGEGNDPNRDGAGGADSDGEDEY